MHDKSEEKRIAIERREARRARAYTFAMLANDFDFFDNDNDTESEFVQRVTRKRETL